jgi:hypothetical protein
MIWPLPRFIFLSKRAAEVFRQSCIEGVRVRSVAELNFDGGTLSPGRLSYWMPETRARLLGRELGID